MSFKAVLEADIKGFSSNIDKAISDVDRLEKTTLQKLSKVGDSFISIGKKASILSGAILAGTTAVAVFARKTGDMANDLLSATVALDSSADMLQEYKLISIEAGTDTEAFSSAVQALTRRLKEVGGEGDDTTDYIDKLGVAMLDTSGQMRRTGDITNDIIKSLASMENVSERNVIASQLFGRQWVSIAPILGLGADGIEQVRAKAHELGIVLSGDALDAANKFSIEMNVIDARLSALRDNLASNLAPLLSETVVPIIENKVIPALTDFGEKLGGIVDSFNALPQPTKEFILGVTGVAVAIGPALLALGGMLKALPLLKAGFVALTGPIGLVGGAIILLAANFEDVVKNVTTMWNTFTSGISSSVKALVSLITLDFKGFWTNIKEMVGNGVKWVVGQMEFMGEKLSWVLRKVGLDDWADKINTAFGKININQAALEAALAANEMTGSMGANKKAVEDTIQPTIDLAKANEDLAESQGKVVESLKAMRLVIPQKETYSLFNELFTQSGSELILNPTIEPNIDPATLKSKMYESVKSAMGDLSEGIKVITIDLSSMLSGALTDVFGSVADAMMNGDNMMAALGASLLGTLGGIMVQLGEMVIATGSAIEAVKAALSSLGGIGAIAAGVALIAIGSLFKAGARKLSRSMGSGGAGYSSAPSLRNTGPGYAPSEYRGQYTDDFKVEFKIGTNELVGVLNTAEQRRNRL